MKEMTMEEIQPAISMPLISVVVPVYNVEDYLRECLDSVVGQSYRNLEIIIIDDGSNDNSGEICDYYLSIDDRIQVIHQSNRGLGNARNVGMRKASGDYIIFIDSDDYWQLNTLENLIHEAANNDLDAVVFSAKPFYDGIESSDYKGFKYTHSAQNNIVKRGANSLSFARDCGEYYAQACLRMYRLDYLRYNGFEFDEGIIHEDESFSFLAYIKAARIECLGERYYQRRYRPGSIMMTCDFFQSSHGYRVAIDTLLDYMQHHQLTRHEQKLFKNQITGYIYTIYRRYQQSLQNEVNNTQSDKSDNDYSKLISNDVKSTLRNVCMTAQGLPAHKRILFYSFPVGYNYWKLRSFASSIKWKILKRIRKDD